MQVHKSLFSVRLTAFLMAIFVWTAVGTQCLAQSSEPAAGQMMTWEDFVMWMNDANGEDEDWSSETFDELQELHINPLNINTASEQDLSVLPFLSLSQIRDIIYYRTVNGPLFSLGELMFITSLDKYTREAMMLFCYAGDTTKDAVTLQSLWRHARSELAVRTDVPFYRRAAYTQYPDSILRSSPNKVYTGNSLYNSLRYSLTSMDHADVGVQLEKDPGESGIDHHVWYAMIHDMGAVKSAIVGNYKASFGQGLVVNTGSVFGKSMMMNSIGRMDKGFRKHSSMSEYGYFSGGATTVDIKGFLVSVYASYRKQDGTFNSDSSGVSSLKTDGYHRTLLEQSKKGNLGVTDAGGNIHYGIGRFQFSATMAYTHFSTPLMPKHDTESSLYRLYNAQGRDFMAYSLAYSYRGNRVVFAGETAGCKEGGIASMNSLQWNMNSSNSITCIQRFYSYRYVSINGKCFGENSLPKNEDGVYIGWNSNISKQLKLAAYVDGMYFPWLKYQVSGSSYGIDGMMQSVYTPSSKVEFTLRYKIKSKQKDYKYLYLNNNSRMDTMKVLQYNTNQSLRVQCTYSPNAHLSFKTAINGVMVSFGPSAKEFGHSIAETVQWQDSERRMRFCLTTTYFNTDSYNARIYNYEPSLLYTFGMTSYYYKGIRIAGLASFPIIRNLFLTAKFGLTKYFNKDSIGSGLSMIDASHKEDLQIQLRWKF